MAEETQPSVHWIMNASKDFHNAGSELTTHFCLRRGRASGGTETGRRRLLYRVLLHGPHTGIEEEQPVVIEGVGSIPAPNSERGRETAPLSQS